MTTLAKGLAVLGAFGRQRPTMTLSEAAAVADLSRATARRVLRTLSQLGYVEQDGRTFSLSPRILDLGFAYLSAQSWIDRALPLMRELSERLGESCSAAILQGTDIVYVARVPARRIMSAALSVGSRLPAFHTSLGRVQLGFLDDSRDLAAAEVAPHRGLHAPDHHRPAGAVRPHPRRPRAGLLHRRRGTGARAALARRADARPQRTGASAPSTCRPTRPARRATKCASVSSPSSTASPSRSRRRPSEPSRRSCQSAGAAVSSREVRNTDTDVR